MSRFRRACHIFSVKYNSLLINTSQLILIAINLQYRQNSLLAEFTKKLPCILTWSTHTLGRCVIVILAEFFFSESSAVGCPAIFVQ